MTEIRCSRDGCPGEYDDEQRDRCPKCGARHGDGEQGGAEGQTTTLEAPAGTTVRITIEVL